MIHNFDFLDALLVTLMVVILFVMITLTTHMIFLNHLALAEHRAYVAGVHWQIVAQFRRVEAVDMQRTKIIKGLPESMWLPELVTQEERP